MKPKVTFSIDWLRGVTAQNYLSIDFVPPDDLYEFVPFHGAMGYDRGWEDKKLGVQLFMSSTREDMGICWNWTGQALEKLRIYLESRNDVENLAEVGVDKLSCARIDLACDIWDEGESAHRFAVNAEKGVLNFIAKKSSVTRSTGKGAHGVTTYIGARTSPLFIRVYDKFSESKGKVPATRVEIELKAQYAKVAHQALFSTDMSSPLLSHHFIGWLARGVSKTGVALVDTMLSGQFEEYEVARQQASMTRWEWLKRQVLPALVDDANDNAGVGVLMGMLWSAFQARTNPGAFRASDKPDFWDEPVTDE